VLIFTDEASFRQDSTLHATWSRVGCRPEVPVTGERKSVKILGAIKLWRPQFDYRQDTVFNASTYLGFLEQLARRYRRQGAIMIQDNAPYHKDAEVWGWFKANRHWLEVHQLPPYSPELNPTERLWQHTRKNGTHNRFFAGLDALVATPTRVFGEIRIESARRKINRLLTQRSAHRPQLASNEGDTPVAPACHARPEHSAG
jgi:transposase